MRTSITLDQEITDFITEIESTEEYAVVSAKSDISVMIYARMQECGVTCAELSRRLGKSRAYVSKMLGGGTNMTIETLVRIARVLDCDFSVFVSRGKDDMRRAHATIDNCKRQKTGEVAPQSFPHYAGRPAQRQHLQMVTEEWIRNRQRLASVQERVTPCDEQMLIEA